MNIKDPPSIATPTEELATQLLQEENVDEIKNIIDLFNLNIKKKDVIRISRLNDLQDKVYEQLDKRITFNADTFSNKDLLDYYKVFQDTINKADTASDNIVEPRIQLNQNNVNVSIGQPLDRDSRQNILDAVNKVLQKAQNPEPIETQASIVEESEIEFYD